MKKIVFFGDSITRQFEYLQQFDNIVNLGVSGDKTINLIGRFIDLKKETPDAIFMMIGINDILVKHKYWGDFVSIDFNVLYHSLITLLHDNIDHKNIYLMSILPIDINYKNNELNKEILKCNNFIKQVANKYLYHYIDLHKYFLENNHMKQEYTLDGVHLSSKGYKNYLEVVAPFFCDRREQG